MAATAATPWVGRRPSRTRHLRKAILVYGGLTFYAVLAGLPIYWMVNMSFKTNEEILSSFSLFPQHFTWANYKTIFTDESWYSATSTA